MQVGKYGFDKVGVEIKDFYLEELIVEPNGIECLSHNQENCVFSSTLLGTLST
jgi:hypothetical protein